MLQLENEEEEELITAVADGLTSVLEAYLDTALPLLEGLMQEIGVLVRPEASVEEKRIGVCIMDDVLEYSAEGGAWGFPKVAEEGWGASGLRDMNGRAASGAYLCTQDDVPDYSTKGVGLAFRECMKGQHTCACSVHGQDCPCYLVVCIVDVPCDQC